MVATTKLSRRIVSPSPDVSTGGRGCSSDVGKAN